MENVKQDVRLAECTTSPTVCGRFEGAAKLPDAKNAKSSEVSEALPETRRFFAYFALLRPLRVIQFVCACKPRARSGFWVPIFH